MAAPTTQGLTPQEVAFVAENEVVEVVPRQRLESVQLVGGPTPALVPPQRATIPLWLALLLKKQSRANIVIPAWMTVDSLTKILDFETELPKQKQSDEHRHPAFTSSTPIPPVSQASLFRSAVVSPPFVESSTSQAPADALPYHWLEIAHLLLESAADDLPEADTIRRLVRDLRECRAAKMRAIVDVLEGNRHLDLRGVSAMEVAEHRLFVAGVVDGLRKIGASRETTRREREEEERAAGGAGDDDDDDEMEYVR